MRNRSFPVRILGWLTGVSLCLAATAVWAQPPDLGLPLGGGQDNAGFLLGAERGGSGGGRSGSEIRCRLYHAGARSLGPVVHFGNLAAPGSHTYSITQPPGGPRPHDHQDRSLGRCPRDRQVSDASGLPRSNTMRMPFPDLPLESHSGTVKWVAPIQFAPGVRARDGQDPGKVNVQLCDAKGCVQPKDYPFSAALRPDVRAVAVAGAEGPRNSSCRAASCPATAGSPAASAPAGHASCRAGAIVPPRRRRTRSSRPKRPSREPRRADGEIDWLPFTNARDLRRNGRPGLRPGADSRKCSQGRMSAWGSSARSSPALSAA